MKHYLFVTTPEYAPVQFNNGDEESWWSCAKTTEPGDQAFVYVTRQGIRFEWELVSAARPHSDWEYICDYRFIRAFDPPIPIGRIREAFTRDEWKAPYANFRGQRAILISDDVADRLRRLGRSAGEPQVTARRTLDEQQREAEEWEATVGLVEGAARQRIVRAFERNPRARQRCLEIFGTACCICGFRFGSTYGAAYEDFIHVHHLLPISEIGEEYEVDPERDLRPVCPNCHAVIHRSERALTIDEVRALLTDNARSDQR